jgi:putative endonuclease
VKAKYTGRFGEDIAAKYLEIQGYLVLQRNKRIGPMELDVVCRQGQLLVVVEVKTSKAKVKIEKHRRLGQLQRSHLLRAARRCMNEHLWAREVRMDVIWIQLTKESMQLEHEKDAFYAF